MSFALGLFLQLQALVAAGSVLALALRWLGRSCLFPLDHRSELRLLYLLIAMLVALLFVPLSLQPTYRMEPFVRVVEASAPNANVLALATPAPRIVVGQAGMASKGIALEICAILALL